ncbi:lipoxygenase 2.1, chloroplastic-like [Phragmites australis]|uniref:lipoxygenase 2.1, chloroplastic-like n=1 Tax=Phragmites australis TaxID=29695 RepID=UPI002D76F502|nr:lipoxygenase 2.1, chloroplastic-like [Phragmites australis]
MLTATQLLGSVVLSPSNGPSSFTSTVSSSRRTAAPCRGRSSTRRTVSKVSCSSDTLTEANGQAVRTQPVDDTGFSTTLQHHHQHQHPHPPPHEKTITMKATVTVHTNKDADRDTLMDLWHKEWLLLELASSELNPKTGQERERVSCHARHSCKHDDEFDMYEATFTVPASFGPVGAVRVQNGYDREMLLGDIKVFHDGKESSAVTFHGNSWIHSSVQDPRMRTFFPLKSYLPSQTPKGVEQLRRDELEAIRGTGYHVREEFERIYDYDVYNDLGDPDHDLATKRPVLGGKEHPYPRRCRTGRARSKKDPLSEVRANERIYVPRDEAFTERKEGAFQAKYTLSALHAYCTKTRTSEHKNLSFPSAGPVDALFEEGSKNQPKEVEGSLLGSLISQLEKELTNVLKGETEEFVKDLRKIFKFETPEVHDKDKFAWFRDEEFARQTLAGMNPLSIELVTKFPIVSKLDEGTYGRGDSLITKELIEEQINRVMTAEEAVKNKKLFMLDYHDMLLPYVNTVRKLNDTTLYGSRTLFFLTEDETLRPIAIELTRPKSPTKPQWRQVFTPGSDCVTGSWLWQLAKVHVLAHDTGYHQLVSHWLRTHCCVEPYIIAANRQLSQMHPIYRLLHPHFRFTMAINALARELLICADGFIESSFAPGKYCMELSSAVYDKFWQFDMEALPADLIRRGMAAQGKDGNLELSIKDYPYANDGLLVWDSIKEWASDYVKHYSRYTEDIKDDTELQHWWGEVIEKGHADKKHEKWWPKLDSHESLVQVLTTIMWVTSGHHAAVNFGQYPFAGYFPNRPTIARRNMPPDMGLEDMSAFVEDPEKVLLDTFPSQYQSTLVLPVLDVLSSHSSGEEYMGTHAERAWLADENIKSAFEQFQGRMAEIAGRIDERNKDPTRKNRYGAGVVPYVLLKPSHDDPKTVMEMGIPYSISI